MAKRLFVGGLAWATDDAGLRAAFERFGEVEDCKVMTDRDTGRSRGFGFITFVEEGAANEAIEQMNGAELDGRSLTVNEARARTGGGGGGGGYGGGRGGGGYGGGGGGYGGGGGGGYGGGGGSGGGGGGRGRGRGGRGRGRDFDDGGWS